MFKFNNNHIFTGYLKQKLSALHIPACRIYKTEYAQYKRTHGKEDPRVIESFDAIAQYNSLGAQINYIKQDAVYKFFWPYNDTRNDLGHDNARWQSTANVHYDSSKAIFGLTKNLVSPGYLYDIATHEYLGDYLRFLRDYHNINLMSLYNCFNNKVITNINVTVNKRKFDSRDSEYQIYAIPVKLFENYTVAVDSAFGIEMFCGFYNNTLDISSRGYELMSSTYQKINKTIFNQPFIYNKLDVTNWPAVITTDDKPTINLSNINRWDIALREQDLKLFIKVPKICKSSIVILEGDYRNFNDCIYKPKDSTSAKWQYNRNHSIINIGGSTDRGMVDVDSNIKLISKLQLLAFNTGESYPFADRLVEYLSGSAITPLDPIPDNIKRAQAVMEQNGHYFKIDGIWENKMQKIIYDYLYNDGHETGISFNTQESEHQLVNSRKATYPKLGYNMKSNLFDILGYIDKEADKWYASWEAGSKVKNTIQNVDIYNDLYNI